MSGAAGGGAGAATRRLGPPARGPGGLGAALAQARWSALRMIRGRTVWLAWIFALLPVGFTLMMAKAGHGAPWQEMFFPLAMLVGVLAPLFMASSMAEEIEDRTYTYLWSRPVPRWSVLVGKLMAAAPIAGGILAFTVAASFVFAENGTPVDLARGIGAVLLGALATCGVAGGLAVLLPRVGLGATYAYLLALDLPVGAIPFSLRNLSITHQIRQMAGVPGDGEAPLQAALWLLGIGALWLAIGIWRLSRSEFSSAER